MRHLIKATNLFNIAAHDGVHRKTLSIALLCVVLVISGCSESNSNSTTSSDGTSTGTDDTVGIGGSTARMTIAGEYLYAIAGDEVQLFDISQPGSANPWTKIRIDWDIQTLFPYGDYLLVGAADGVHILDNTDQASPRYISDFTHARAQDPVVAANDVAYVTLQSTAQFIDASDQMDVIDISDITQPTLIDTIPMQSPEGLSVDNGRLFVCDGIAGVKIFDVTAPREPDVVGGIRDIECNDVIAQGDLLYLITDDSLLQYDIEELPPIFLSEISAAR